ncbi:MULTISPECIES: acyl-CoA dehydrogenase family protein [Actinoplanes]|uniref:acyl-CoA dehydrogenase family protein n=1 Tax=Actinoplanes TaxID=1865 RepID=UPI0005F2CE41|nr:MULTISPECIES: acyl-CoA dehydrogenase family protein [Actinoplanes]GLY02724.1 acyl-CoA dehydrogenase [Actinoplanes sp. NBRC 101535]
MIDSVAREVAGIAAEHADDVDRLARFPSEAIGALREAGLLYAGVSLRELVAITETLGAACASTAMTFAMHHIQLACLLRHGESEGLRRFTEQASGERWLLASATSEAGVGGDIRTSIAALIVEGDGYRVDKKASTISYGAHADAVLATARRHPDAAPGDQVLVVVPVGGSRMEQLSDWDTLGMRGTCSAGFRLTALVPTVNVFPHPFDRILRETMLPFSHILWAACWVGIAGSALSRARVFLRRRERAKPGAASAATARLARAYGRLQMAGSMVAAAAEQFDRKAGDRPERWSTDLQLANVKVAVSEIAGEVTFEALTVCGIAGYQERGPASIARHLRDVLSAPMMVANERLLATGAGLLMSHKEEAPILGSGAVDRV